MKLFNSLKDLLSTELHSVYQKIITERVHSLNNMDQSDENAYNSKKKEINRLCDITTYLRKSSWKDNIMKECASMFYDGEFMNKLDQNPYLLCFKNCVVDFKKKTHRVFLKIICRNAQTLIMWNMMKQRTMI